jgi:hypothetical protein
MWINPDLVNFRFIPGYKYPEKSPILSKDKNPNTWVPALVAAFNGGYHLKDSQGGGYYYAGKVVKPLKPGQASLVIDNNGVLTVTPWRGGNLNGLAVVRQNLKPLIMDGRSQVKSSDTYWTWGGPVGKAIFTARSALGELPDGGIVFARGASVSPNAMASVMVKLGVSTAMMLDMNPHWPTGIYYTAAVRGGKPVAHKIMPFDIPASIYYKQDQKDFIVALAN